ncbi:MAG: hypothetical protein KGH65_04480 [Candidatus Micrarchaeota archaeon]|nr:hypothetical protein [Candidatus Micrarchaeota archaeon]
MAAFSQINVKAAAITGAAVGLLCWLLGAGIGFSGMPMYGFLNGGMMGYYMMGSSGYAVLYLITLGIVGAVVGAIIGFVYNWALKLK